MNDDRDARDARNCDLVRRALAGDRRAGDALLRENAAYARARVLKRRPGARTGSDPLAEDLCQEALSGLWDAAIRFDEARGIPFLAYAKWWIDARVLACARKAPVVNTPVRSESQNAALYAVARLAPVDLDAPACRAVADPDAGPESACLDASDHRMAGALLSFLPARERRILSDRAEGRTLEETGAGLGITRERTRQIERAAKARLRRIADGRENAARARAARTG